MRKQIYRILINTLALFIAAQLLPIQATTFLHYFFAGIVLGLVNLSIRPLLIILTIPFNLLTFGIFTLVVNTWMILLTSGLLPGFYVPGFWVAFLTSLIVSVANWVLKDSLRS
jgi:putative membrane protein